MISPVSVGADDAAAAQAQPGAWLSSGRHVHHRISLNRVHPDAGAQRRLNHSDCHVTEHVVSLSPELRIPGHAHFHQQIAVRTAVAAWLALAGEPDALPVAHSARDFHLVAARALLLAGAIALRAGGGNDLTPAEAARTRAAERESDLNCLHVAGAAALRAGFRFGAGFCAGAAAFLARKHARHGDVHAAAVHHIVKRDFYARSEVPAANRSRASGLTGERRLAPEELAEDVLRTA